MKASGVATDWEEIDRFDGGVGWIAHPEESMQRASHALVVDGRVWLVDPVDASGLDALLESYGEVAGVVLLLDRHRRDCTEIARRHDVSVWIPDFFDGVADTLDAPTERFRSELADTGYTVSPVVKNRFWQEALLYNDDTKVLVVSEAVGTAEYFRTDEERLGVHPMLRLTPPRILTRLEPDRILVGHGPGVHENAATALREAIDSARRRAPKLMLKTLKTSLAR